LRFVIGDWRYAIGDCTDFIHEELEQIHRAIEIYGPNECL
jgi:hypothetical protein